MTTSYFSHDSNARNSEKMIKLRMKYGAEGYGVYFMILERLREEHEYMSIKDYNVIAFDLRVDASEIKSIIEDFGLFVFTDDGKYFYSNGFNERMALKDSKTKKLAEAGKRGAKKRWQQDSHPIATPSKNNSHPNRVLMASDSKRSKEKKREVNKEDEEDVHTRPSDSAPKKSFDLWQELWGFPNSIAQQDLWEWIDTLGDDVVCYGIGLAGKKNVSANGADTWLDHTFNNWAHDGVDSLKKAQEAAEKHDQRVSNSRGGYRKSTVKETLPDWANDDQPGTPEPQKQLTLAQKHQLAEQLARLKSNTASKEG